jgi:penicillin-binding protein-related factor A (putative recombinase)
MKGIAFLLIEFTELNIYIRLNFDDLNCFWGKISSIRGSKSVAIEELLQHQVKQNCKVTIDFLEGYY